MDQLIQFASHLSMGDATVLAGALVVAAQYVVNNLLPDREAEDAWRFLKAFSGILLLPGVATVAVAFGTEHTAFLHQYPWVSVVAAVLYYTAERIKTAAVRSRKSATQSQPSFLEEPTAEPLQAPTESEY